MSESENGCFNGSLVDLCKIVDAFIEEFNTLKLMDDVVIRNPPSKHQEKIRQLCDMVRGFEHNYNVLKDEGTKNE